MTSSTLSVSSHRQQHQAIQEILTWATQPERPRSSPRRPRGSAAEQQDVNFVKKRLQASQLIELEWLDVVFAKTQKVRRGDLLWASLAGGAANAQGRAVTNLSAELETIFDYLVVTRAKPHRKAWPQILQEANGWYLRQRQEKVRRIAEDTLRGTRIDPKRVVFDLGHGYFVYRLTGVECTLEGNAMGHCLTGHGIELSNEYGIRGPGNEPFVTFNYTKNKLGQAKGRWNHLTTKDIALTWAALFKMVERDGLISTAGELGNVLALVWPLPDLEQANHYLTSFGKHPIGDAALAAGATKLLQIVTPKLLVELFASGELPAKVLMEIQAFFRAHRPDLLPKWLGALSSTLTEVLIAADVSSEAAALETAARQLAEGYIKGSAAAAAHRAVLDPESSAQAVVTYLRAGKLWRTTSEGMLRLVAAVLLFVPRSVFGACMEAAGPRYPAQHVHYSGKPVEDKGVPALLQRVLTIRFSRFSKKELMGMAGVIPPEVRAALVEMRPELYPLTLVPRKHLVGRLVKCPEEQVVVKWSISQAEVWFSAAAAAADIEVVADDCDVTDDDFMLSYSRRVDGPKMRGEKYEARGWTAELPAALWDEHSGRVRTAFSNSTALPDYFRVFNFWFELGRPVTPLIFDSYMLAAYADHVALQYSNPMELAAAIAERALTPVFATGDVVGATMISAALGGIPPDVGVAVTIANTVMELIQYPPTVRQRELLTILGRGLSEVQDQLDEAEEQLDLTWAKTPMRKVWVYQQLGLTDKKGDRRAALYQKKLDKLMVAP